MSLESCRTKKRQRTAALQDLPTFIALRTSRSVLECGSPLPLWLACAGIMLCCFLASAALPANFASGFDTANRLYEEGKFTEAADVYSKLIQQGAVSPTVYFNLGNAWFKAGQLGRAIAAYREAEQLAPRDPQVRFNLQFVRKKVTGSEISPVPQWDQWLANLTLNEWTGLACAALWILFALLAIREISATARAALRTWCILAGIAVVVSNGFLLASFQTQVQSKSGVVIVPNVVVRYGPLEESHVFYQLRDGSEVRVLDQKRTGQDQAWVQVQDASGRTGWLKKPEIILLEGRT